MTPAAAYDELVRWSRQQSLLNSCMELLGWDELTYMPRGGVENRANQLAYLSGMYHDGATDPRVGEWLAAAESNRDSAADRSRGTNLRVWRRGFERARKVPRTLVQELMSVATTAQQEWSEARRNNEFGQFLPWLTQILRLKREEAACLADGGPLYDVLLEDFEPGMTAARLDGLFGAMQSQLAELIDSLPVRKRRKGAGVLKRTYPVDLQRIFIEGIASDLGFDFDCGRLDTTTHPFFCTIGPGDVRITTRFNSSDFSEAFFSSLHELGHGLFEQGLPAQWTGLPAGQCQSLALHESQSRFWENCVGRSPAFWAYAFPKAQELFHDALHDVALDQFLGAVNQVERGWNRVRADEATYNLHIFVRYELEKALLTGDLAPADLPGAWEESYRRTLGVAPPDDAEGCLQDSHWASGQFGYFPTYALGNVFAAHLFDAVRKAIPDLDQQFADGDYRPLQTWMRENLYAAGEFDDGWALVERICGEPVDPNVLTDLLRRRFGE